LIGTVVALGVLLFFVLMSVVLPAAAGHALSKTRWWWTPGTVLAGTALALLERRRDGLVDAVLHGYAVVLLGYSGVLLELCRSARRRELRSSMPTAYVVVRASSTS
jgi:hypothetical protein